jgi:hypothetical protein
MTRLVFLFATLLLTSPLASIAQTVTGVPRSQQGYRLEIDAVGRQEWTTERYGGLPDDHRWRLRLLPHVELGSGRLILGVGGDFNYSSDENTRSLAEGESLPDNYESRSARLDRAYLRLQPTDWLRFVGGRFEMPIPLTEMLWDADLRPQGGSVSIELGQLAGRQQLTLTGLWARGSHILEDDHTTLMAGSAGTSFWSGVDSQFQISASYLQFDGHRDADALDARLFRQNSVDDEGALALDYRVADISVRLVNGGAAPTQFYADYCWNTATDSENRGLWIGLVLGSLLKSRGRWDYTYARVDRDATLAAYAQDDFLWATGWEGHRGELALNVGRNSSMHIIGQLQRPKELEDSQVERPWTRRLRIEWRFRSSS